MRIGLDLTNLNPDYRGGSNTYSEGLLQGIISSNYKNNLQVYVNKYYYLKKKLKRKKNKISYVIYERNGLIIFLNKIYNRVFPFLTFFIGKYKYFFDYKIRNFLNTSFKNIVEKNCDILITPNVTLTTYNLKVPTIVNPHDIQQVHFPELFSFKERLLRDYTYYNTVKYSSKIIASLNYIKKDLLKHYTFLKSSKIKVIYAGIDLKKYNSKKLRINKKKDYIFFPSQLWPHKNHLLVLNAYKKYLKKSKKKIKLILSGQNSGKFSDNILYKVQSISPKHIKYLGPISHKKLLEMYKSSICTICPAIYEASALPMLESFALKTFVMISNIPSHIEEAKNYNVLNFKYNSKKSLEKKFLLLDNLKKIDLKKINNRNYNIVKKYSWKNQSIKWLNICTKII